MRINDTSCYRVIDKTREGRIRKVRITVQGHPEYRIQGRQIIPSDNANAVSHEKLVSAEGVSERNYYESYKVMIQGAGGRQIFKQDHVRSNRSKRGASLVAIVPAGLFSNGDCILTLQGVGAGAKKKTSRSHCFESKRNNITTRNRVVH